MDAIDRRTFLKMTGLGAGVVTLGGLAWRVGGVWWDQPAAAEYKILSAREVQIFDAIAEAMFPGEGGSVDPIPNGVEAGVTDFFDRFLADVLHEGPGNALRVLVHAIDEMAIGADFGLTRFHKRSLEQRIEILQAWENSSLAPRRAAFSAIKLFASMGYCENPHVLRAIGIEYTCGGLA